MMLTKEQVTGINDAGHGCTILFTNVTPDKAEDKTLPTNAYLLELKKDGKTWFDLVMGDAVSIFDKYYDYLGHCMVRMLWTKGTRQPAMYKTDKPKQPPKKQPKK